MISKEQLISVAQELMPSILDAGMELSISSGFKKGMTNIKVWHCHNDYKFGINSRTIYEFNDEDDLEKFLNDIEKAVDGGKFND